MTESAEGNSRKLVEKALLEIKQLKAKVKQYERQLHKPIAVVGIGCRFPGGVNHADDFWEMLANGKHGITQLYQQRWRWDEFYDADAETPGKVYTRGMGLLEDFEYFDNEFFGIPATEVESMDPQHRLLLEVAWQAIEHAGYGPAQLAGQRVGTYIGIATQDYSQVGNRLGNPEDLTPWHGIGNAFSAAAGRINHLLDLRGPAVALETACSSSLVALHDAVAGIRRGECEAALVGGVGLIINPCTSIIFSKAQMLSRDGSCKTFDANANGYVRSEGCGVVMLKPLQQALKDGDSIHGVIQGAAVNHDGKTQGITAPSELAQQQVLSHALENARCDANDIGYLEAHGTGTPLGDPVELAAVQSVYGKERSPDNPLWIGSVKTNLGHMEAAAGISGFIKLLLAIKRQQIPPHLHMTNPNPYVPWQQMPVRVPERLEPWAGLDQANSGKPYAKRYGGVSSFGFSGTNAHVVVSDYLEEATAESATQRHWPCPVSAKSMPALAERLQQLTHYLSDHPDTCIEDMAMTLAAGRDHHRHRILLWAENTSDLQSQLETLQDQIETQAVDVRSKRAQPASLLCGGLDNVDDNVVQTLLQQEPSLALHFFHYAKQAGESDQLPDSIEEACIGLQQNPIKQLCLHLAVVAYSSQLQIPINEFIGTGVGVLAAAIAAQSIAFDHAVQWLRGERDSLTCLAPQQKLSRLSEQGFESIKRQALPGLLEQLKQQDWPVCTVPLGQPDRSVILTVGKGWQSEEQTLLTLQGTAAKQNDQASRKGFQQWLQQLYLAGVSLDWSALFSHPDSVARRIPLPTYPFQRKRFLNPLIDHYYLEGLLDEDNRQWVYQLQNLALPTAPTAKVMGDSKDSVHDDTNEYSLVVLSGRAEAWAESGATVLSVDFQKQSFDESVAQQLNEQFSENASTDSLQALILDLPTATELLDRAGQTRRFQWILGISHWLQSSAVHPKLYLYSEHSGPEWGFWRGIGKALAVELAPYWGGLLLNQTQQSLNQEKLQAVFSASQERLEDAFLFQPDGIEVERLTRVDPSSLLEPHHYPAPIKSGALYLVSGGSGGVGESVLRWLMEKGAKHISVVSRSGFQLEGGLRSLANELNVTTYALSLDLTQSDARSQLQQQVEAIGLPLKGIFHAAGQFDLTPVSQLTPEQCVAISDVKVSGCRVLHELSLQCQPDLFVTFSSIAAAWGSAGNLHYAAANAYLDSFIVWRQQQGLPGLSIQWGPWQGKGMAFDNEEEARRRGLHPLANKPAILLLEYLLSVRQSQAVVADVDWVKFKTLMSLFAQRGLFSSLEAQNQTHNRSDQPTKPAPESTLEQTFSTPPGQLRKELLALPPEQRAPIALSFLVEQIADAMRMEPEEIDTAAPLMNLGVDSILAVTFRNRVRHDMEMDLPLAQLMEGASLENLVEFFLKELDADQDNNDNEAALDFVEGEL